MSKKDLNVLKLKKKFSLNDRTIQIYNNFKTSLNKSLKSQPFLVGVSGGPDSLALTVLSYIYSKEKKSKVYYVLVNHNIRNNSSKEAAQVKKLLQRKRIQLSILTNKKLIKSNIQKQAREIRYNLLLNFCKKKKIKYILTAHHRDDQIETFLIRLSRGSGVQGLSSMKKVSKINSNIKLVRPLLDEKKKHLVSISKDAFKKVFKDPSNYNDKFLRTKIRNLKKQFNKNGIKDNQILKSIQNLASTRDTLNEYLNKVFKSCILKKKNKIFIKNSIFFLESKEIQLKILSSIIKNISKNYYPPRSKKVLSLLSQINNNKDIKRTLGGCVIQNIDNKTLVYKEAPFKKKY